jgi:mycothiol synthase
MAPDAEIKRAPRTWTLYGARDGLDAALAEIAAAGGGPVRWWITEPTDEDRAAAAAHALVPERELLQMRRPLPTERTPPPLALRAFVPGQDEDEWVAVNNRAFAAHPEQGGWTADAVRAREAEPWFDAAGFLLHHDDATHRLAGFVWTKVHRDHDPPLGEIYVIAVDPDFEGRGLGKTLTLAGLDWLHRERGITVGMLYVDKANKPAVSMYTHLGFTSHHTDHAFAGDVAPPD